MPLSYAGVPLAAPTAEIATWIEKNIDPSEVYEFVYPSFLRNALSAASIQYTHWGLTPQRPLYVSRLYWPVGAGRWGLGHFLATDRQLDQIRTAVYVPTPNMWTTGDLVIGDGRFTRTAPMWMLPPRPLSAIPNTNGLWLLTLVDDRYYWWFKGGIVEVEEGVTTWTQLYADIASLLDVTIAVDEISSDYLSPASSITSQYDPLPLLLDGVARSAGQRIVRTLDGQVKALNVTSSQAIVQTNLSRIGPAADQWRKQSGGLFHLSE